MSSRSGSISSSNYSSSSTLSTDLESEPSPEEHFPIRVIEPHEKPEVLRFLREYFFEEEPLNVYMHETNPEKVRYRDRGLNAISFIDEGLSLVSYNHDGGIAAVAIVANIESQGFQETNDHFREIDHFFMVTMALYNQHRMTVERKRREIDLKVICVHPQYRKKGLAYGMLRQIRATGKTVHGFNQLFCRCTCAITLRLLRKFGFYCVYIVYYTHFTQNGIPIFKPAAPNTSCKIMTLNL